MAALPKTMRTILQLDKDSSKLTMKHVHLPVASHSNDVVVKVAATAPWAAPSSPATKSLGASTRAGPVRRGNTRWR